MASDGNYIIKVIITDQDSQGEAIEYAIEVKASIFSSPEEDEDKKSASGSGSSV